MDVADAVAVLVDDDVPVTVADGEAVAEMLGEALNDNVALGEGEG